VRKLARINFDALYDPALFGSWSRPACLWTARQAFVGELVRPDYDQIDQLAIYRKHTRRSTAPTAPTHAAWPVVGCRRAKSLVMALVAIYPTRFGRAPCLETVTYGQPLGELASKHGRLTPLQDHLARRRQVSETTT